MSHARDLVSVLEGVKQPVPDQLRQAREKPPDREEIADNLVFASLSLSLSNIEMKYYPD